MSSVSVTFVIAIALAVDVQAIQCFVDDDVLALPLDSNLHKEVNEEASAAQLLKVTENVQATQPKQKKVTGTTPTPKLQPDCIIEVEASCVVVVVVVVLLLYLFKLQHISLLPLWLIEKRLKYK